MADPRVGVIAADGSQDLINMNPSVFKVNSRFFHLLKCSHETTYKGKQPLKCKMKTKTTGSQSKVKVVADLNHRVSPCQSFHRPPAALCLVVGSVVGLGLHLDLQAVGPGAGRQLPVESRQRRAVKGGGLILDPLIKAECAECGL